MSTLFGTVEKSKASLRRQLSSLPFSRKLQVLDALRQDGNLGLSLKSSGVPTSPSVVPSGQSLLSELIRQTVERQPLNRKITRDSSDGETLRLEIESWDENPAKPQAALQALFPEGFPTGLVFYERLKELQLRMGWEDYSNRAIGFLLTATIDNLEPIAVEALLLQFPSVASPDFFLLLRGLKVPAKATVFRPEFAAQWFPALVRRIGQDLASGDFWEALETYCEFHPASALSILQQLQGAKDDAEIAVAANILGTLRSLLLEKALKSEFERVDAAFRTSYLMLTRSVHQRSWIRAAWRGKMSQTDLANLLEHMWSSTPDEQELAFWILCRSLLSPKLSVEAFTFGLEWLRSKANAGVSPLAKFHIIDFAACRAHEKKWEGDALIPAVLPFPVEHKGSWQCLQAFMVARMETDSAAFSSLCFQLAKVDARGWLKVLREPHHMDYLLSKMREGDYSPMVWELIFSPDSDSRSLGLFFFDELSIKTLPNNTSRPSGDHELRLALLELQCRSMTGETIARFLIALIPSMSRASQELQKMFCDELFFQSKNYAGICREEFAKRVDQFPVLKEAVAKAKRYFDALLELNDSPIQMMEIPGYGQAIQLYRRRFSQEVSLSAERQSVFFSLFSKVRVLYGRQFSSFHDGALSGPCEMQHFSSSVEVPRLEFIDPEGMALRRLNSADKLYPTSAPTLAPAITQ